MVRSAGWAHFACVAFAVAAAAACSKSPAQKGGGGGAGGHAVAVTDKGFEPASIALQRGDSGDLVFTRTSDDTCATEVVFPELHVKEPLPLDKPVTIKVPTESARTFTFTCGMGMYKSQVLVR